eukprot:2314512-Alexandrium_andersonii.AAC.1
MSQSIIAEASTGLLPAISARRAESLSMKASTFWPRQCSSQVFRAKRTGQISAWTTTCVLPGCRHACQ